MSDRLKQPFATGLKSLVSAEWMAVWKAYKEQANEIERLTAEITDGSRQFSKHQAEWWDKQEEMEAEIERLTAENETHRETIQLFDTQCKRYREALEDIRDSLAGNCDGDAEWASEMAGAALNGEQE